MANKPLTLPELMIMVQKGLPISDATFRTLIMVNNISIYTIATTLGICIKKLSSHVIISMKPLKTIFRPLLKMVVLHIACQGLVHHYKRWYFDGLLPIFGFCAALRIPTLIADQVQNIRILE